jgi:hypothetical protein
MPTFSKTFHIVWTVFSSYHLCLGCVHMRSEPIVKDVCPQLISKVFLCLYLQSVPFNIFGSCYKYDWCIWDMKPCTNQCLSIFCQLLAEYPQTLGDNPDIRVLSILYCDSLSFGFLPLLFFTSFHSPLSFWSISFSPSVFSSLCKLWSLTSVGSSCCPIAWSHSEPRIGRRLSSSPLPTHGLWRFSVFCTAWSLREEGPTICEGIMSKSCRVCVCVCVCVSPYVLAAYLSNHVTDSYGRAH